MAGFFKTNNTAPALSPRARLEQKIMTSRGNLLLLILFTVINIVLLVSQSNTYFLFSASIPYLLADFGMFFCGLYPSEYYVGLGFETLDISFLIIMLVIAACILAVYLLCWIFSKKHGRGWLIAALVLFSLDTVSMFIFMDIGTGILLDVLFHAWVIYYLVIGVYAQAKLKNLPEEPATVEAEATELPENETAPAEESTDNENKE